MHEGSFAADYAVPEDASAIADINVRAWRHAYGGIIPEHYLASLDAGSLTNRVRETLLRSNTTLVVRAPAVVGFSWVSSSRDDDAPAGTAEVIALYVDPHHERRGIGRALMHGSLRVAASAGASRVTLWVLGANQAARAFYAALGFAPDGKTKTTERWGGSPVLEVRYTRELSAQ